MFFPVDLYSTDMQICPAVVIKAVYQTLVTCHTDERVSTDLISQKMSSPLIPGSHTWTSAMSIDICLDLLGKQFPHKSPAFID